MPIYLSYFISSSPRTGSSLLSEALEFTGIAGTPREYFEPAYEQDWFDRLGITADSEYIDKFLAAGATPNGVFGAKVIWHQLTHLKTRLRLIQGNGVSDLELLRRTFPDLRYVFLTRRDKVRQAVSYYKASQTDFWHWLEPDAIANRQIPTPSPVPPFDLEQIDHWVNRFTQDEASWCRYFETLGLEPFEVVYEDFHPAYESTVRAVLRYLDIPIPSGMKIHPPRLQKLGDAVSEEWVHRYRELKRPARPVVDPARLSYFLSSTPRTGSFLLAEALQSTQIAGKPREYFDPNFEKQWLEELNITSDTEYFAKIRSAGTTPNGVWSAKVHWHQFVHLTTKLRLIQDHHLSDLELLRLTFADLRYVFLTRRDKVRQAVSYYKAIRTGVWWSIRPNLNGDRQTAESAPVPAPPFDFEQIDYWVTRLTYFESSWRRHFARLGVEPFEVVYEEFVGAYESTVLAILRYLDLPISEGLKVAPPRLQKQADAVSEEWVQRYRELKRL